MKISRVACVARTTWIIRIARFAVVLLAAVLQPAQAMAQTRTPPSPGILAPGPGLAGAKGAPKGADAGFMKDLDALRDTVYGYTLAPAETAVLADSLSARAQTLPMNPRDRNLILSRIEYLAGRAWQPLENSLSEKAEAALPWPGDKKKAIARHEAAIAYAKASMQENEHAEGWMAQAAPLSQICTMKDITFLVLNGPKVGQYAQKALKLDPAHVGARITLAVSKAYPPAMFGGNPAEAIRELLAILDSRPQGFEKDELFDLRAGIGTAYSKLNDAAGARLWFSLALELYPGNAYAKQELAKSGGAK